MIGNITTGNSLFGILAYNKIKATEGGSGVIFCNKMAYARRIMENGELPLIAHTLNDYISGAKRAKENLIFHVSLNPHPDDKLDDWELAEISREYMEKMGFGEQPYVVYKHTDIDRVHLHIVASFIDRDGKKVRWDNDYWRNMDICRELERKHGLVPAVKGQQQDGSAEARIVDYPRGNVKHQVASVVRYITQNYKFSSPGELNTLLNLFNVNVEQVEGTIRDTPYKGVVYQAMQNGEKAGKPFKSSVIGKDVGFAVLQKKYEECKEFLKKKPHEIEKLKTFIADAMKRAKDPHELARLLGEHEIHTIMRRTEDGRIYGVTFADHRNKIVVNGSRLGKEFSAARFHELYGNIAGLSKRPAVQPDGPEPARAVAPLSPDAVSGEVSQLGVGAAGTLPDAVAATAGVAGTAPLAAPTGAADTAAAGSFTPDGDTAVHVAAQGELFAIGTGIGSGTSVGGLPASTGQAGQSGQNAPTGDAGGWSWPDENTVWDDHDYGFDPPEPADTIGRPLEEYVPDMSDPFSMLLETAALGEAYEEQDEQRQRRRRRRKGLKP